MKNGCFLAKFTLASPLFYFLHWLFPPHLIMSASNNKLDETIRSLSRNDATLTALYLCSNEVGDEGAGRLAEALTTNSTLTTLDLEENRVGDEGAGRLAEALVTNSTLTTLYLGSNQVGDEGAGRLAQALVTNST